MRASTQWNVDYLWARVCSGGMCNIAHVTGKPGAAKTTYKRHSAQGLLKHPVCGTQVTQEQKTPRTTQLLTPKLLYVRAMQRVLEVFREFIKGE